MEELTASGEVDAEKKQARMNICDSCEFLKPVWIGGEFNEETNSYGKFTDKILCEACGCNAPWFTGYNIASCPMGKWQ